MTESVKPIDLRRLRATVPPELFELPRFRTLGKALLLLSLLAVALTAGLATDWWVLKLLIGLVAAPFLFALASAGHESGHGTASRYRFVNDLTGLLTMSVIGMPARGWKLKHDLHHKYGGVPGIDTDTEPGLEDYLKRGFVSRTFVRVFNMCEFLFWWMIPVSLWVTTWRFIIIDLTSRRNPRRSHRRWVAADIVVATAFFVATALFTWQFGWLNLVLLVAIPFAASGLFSAVAFVPNHRGMPPLTEEQQRRPARFTHLNSRTVLYPPYLPGNYFMNYVPWQIEHHVFPTVPGFRLKKFSPHLRAYAKSEGLPLQYETVFEAMPRVLSRKWLWGPSDGRLYTYAEAESIRRERRDAQAQAASSEALPSKSRTLDPASLQS